jgi:hypothetical protein
MSFILNNLLKISSKLCPLPTLTCVKKFLLMQGVVAESIMGAPSFIA